MLSKFSAFLRKELEPSLQHSNYARGKDSWFSHCSIVDRAATGVLWLCKSKMLSFFDNRLWAMTTAQKYSISIYQQISANISLCNFGRHCYWILTIEAQKRWKQLVNIPAVFYPVLAPLISPGLAPTPTLPSHCFISFHCTLSTYRSSETLIRNRMEQS